MPTFLLIPLFLSVINQAIGAETCTVTARTCLDGPRSEVINGYRVTRDCWQWQEERTCTTGATVDHCTTLSAETGCVLESDTCESMNSSGVCQSSRRTYACDHVVTGLPADNVALEVRATVEAGFDKQTACATYLKDVRCTETGHVCSATGATRPIDGVDVTLACWEETYSFACETSPESLACALLGQAGCRFESTIEKTPQTTTNRYACLTTEVPTHADIRYEETRTVTDGFETDESECEPFIANHLCTLEAALCEKNVTDALCGVENRTYSCPGALDTDACKLLKTELCTLEKNECTKAADNVCLIGTENYTCRGAVPAPLPDSIQETARGERIDAITPTSTCPTFTNARAVRAGACTEIGRVCTDGAATKIVDGHPVTKDCWGWSVSYRCEGSGETTNGCSTWEAAPNCTLVSDECLAQEGDQCTYATRTYRCEESADRIVETEKCTESVCAYGFCETRDEPGNTELLNAVLKLEVARQAAVYGEYDEVAFFTGEANTCRNKAGDVSCCAGEVKGDMSNQSGLGAMYVFAADTMTEAVKTLGSPYVYDVLASHDSMKPLLNALYGEAASGAYSPSLSYYGITVSYGANGMVFEFNPYVFFAMVAVEVATDYLSCDPDEQALQLKRGQNLCVYLGSRCTQYNMGSCLIKEESHCCYNSRLARIVQEAAHKQLNKSWGTLTAPDCSGLTAYEFMTLDFTQIDLTDFLSDIARQPLAKPDADRTLAQTEARIDALRSQPNKYPAPKAHTDVCANGTCGETP